MGINIEYKGKKIAEATEESIKFIHGPDLNPLLDEKLSGVCQEEDDDGGVLLVKKTPDVSAKLAYLELIGFTIKDVEDVAKSSPRQDKAFSDMKRLIDKEVSDFVKTFKRKPTEQELQARIDKLNKTLVTNTLSKSQAYIATAYEALSRESCKQLGVSYSFTSLDENAVKLLQNQSTLFDSYKGLSDTISNKIHELIRNAYETPKGLNLQQLKKEIGHIAEVSDNRAELIARGETNKISAAARRVSYKKSDPDNTNLYDHIGPDDHRTTDLSKRIKARTKGGVPWDEYVRIVQEESKKDFPKWTVDPDFPVSHYNSRHTFIRRL